MLLPLSHSLHIHRNLSVVFFARPFPSLFPTLLHSPSLSSAPLVPLVSSRLVSPARSLLTPYKLAIASDKREDDKSWPERNIVGKQELEVKLGEYHVSFEVSLTRTFHGAEMAGGKLREDWSWEMSGARRPNVK